MACIFRYWIYFKIIFLKIGSRTQAPATVWPAAGLAEPMSAETCLSPQRTEVKKRFCELDVAGRRALLTIDDERIVGRVYSAVQNLATCARICTETNLPNGVGNGEVPHIFAAPFRFLFSH